MKSIRILITLAVLSLSPYSYATIYTINASVQGWDVPTPTSPQQSPYANYIAGCSGGYIFRDFFIFDLSGLGSGSIISATLSIYNPGVSQGDLGNGFLSPHANETYQIGSVSTPLNILAQGTGGAAVFNDLAAGTLWGAQVVSSSDNGAFVQIPLNASFLAAAEPDLGTGAIGFGGHLVGDTGFTQNEYIFGFTGTANGPIPQLRLEVVPVPEPSSLVLGGFLATVCLRRWLRRN